MGEQHQGALWWESSLVKLSDQLECLVLLVGEVSYKQEMGEYP